MNNYKSQIDNSGLHAIDKILKEKVLSKNKLNKYTDIDSLLHICVLLIISDDIYLNHYETDRIIERSDNLLKILKSEGVNNITFIYPDEKDFYTLLNENAKNAAIELQNKSFSTIDKEMILSLSPDITHQEMESRKNLYEHLSKGTLELQDLKGKARKNKMEGAVDYMIASNGLLREQILKISRNHKLVTTEDQYIFSQQVNAYLRVILNNKFSKKNGNLYAPSIGRANLIHQSEKKIINLNGKPLENGNHVTIPYIPLERKLLKEAKGNPYKMLETALIIRDKAKKVRELYSSIDLNNYNKKIIQKILPNLDQALQDLADSLDMNLKLTNEEFVHLFGGFALDSTEKKHNKFISNKPKSEEELKMFNIMLTESSDANFNPSLNYLKVEFYE